MKQRHALAEISDHDHRARAPPPGLEQCDLPYEESAGNFHGMQQIRAQAEPRIPIAMDTQFGSHTLRAHGMESGLVGEHMASSLVAAGLVQIVAAPLGHDGGGAIEERPRRGIGPGALIGGLNGGQ